MGNMPNGGISAHFGVMEVFANIIPGVVILTGVVAGAVLSVPGSGDLLVFDIGVEEFALVAVLSLVVGMFLDFAGVGIEGLIDAVLKRLKPRPHPAEENGDRSDTKLVKLLESKSMSGRFEELSTKPHTPFENEFWAICRHRFPFASEIGRGDTANQVGDSNVDFKRFWRTIHAHQEPSRYSLSVRYRALGAMCRGLWTGFVLLFFYYYALYVLPFRDAGGGGSLLLIGVLVSGVFTVVFWGAKDRFKTLWFEFLIVEFYLDHRDERSN